MIAPTQRTTAKLDNFVNRATVENLDSIITTTVLL